MVAKKTKKPKSNPYVPPGTPGTATYIDPNAYMGALDPIADSYSQEQIDAWNNTGPGKHEARMEADVKRQREIDALAAENAEVLAENARNEIAAQEKATADTAAAKAEEDAAAALSDDPKNWEFEGPFTSSQYRQIHNQGNLGASPPSIGGAAVGGKYASYYGVRSRSPRSTPKYVRYFKNRIHDFVETTARMYIKVNGRPDKFVAELGSDENTKAIARVLVGSQDKLAGVSSGGKGYIDFFLQQANHALSEKVQIAEVLSDNYVAFFFGQSAPIFRYSGSLMNTFQDDWAMNMLRLYRDIGRGSQTARRGVLFYLKYDSMIISGSLLNLNWVLTGDTEIVVPFSFDFLVRKVHIIYNGLEPPTDFTRDSSISGISFFPIGYNPQESGNRALQGKVDDILQSDSTYGASGAAISQGGNAPPLPIPGPVDTGPVAAPTVPIPAAAGAVDQDAFLQTGTVARVEVPPS